jgi:hypothetical protein
MKKEKTVIPDARFIKGGSHVFVEIDNMQVMAKNEKKIEDYKLLTNELTSTGKKKPLVVFYTSTFNRKKRLDEWCDRAELNYVVLSKEDL